ncbi:MAG TPA: hypothetical protein DCR93_01755 [Cytophagales bacterium]|nr:hypothetical protein [Cytophagales bacterium]HAP58277.1 hypothetical protein [Cytophagales bacterium]
MTKSQVLETLDHLPEDFPAEQLIEAIREREMIAAAERQVEEEKVISLEEAKNRMRQKWSK